MRDKRIFFPFGKGLTSNKEKQSAAKMVIFFFRLSYVLIRFDKMFLVYIEIAFSSVVERDRRAILLVGIAEICEYLRNPTSHS